MATSPPPSTAAAPTSCRRVLTVGDGNFSYSLALTKVAKDCHQRIRLTASSYDSYEELVDKYPESGRLVEQLTELGATVLHRVDATNLRESVRAASSGQAGKRVLFDSVVFNHPHCGEENIARHQSLLSHFYSSALEMLDASETHEDSGIHLTLAEGQPERWQAVQRAHAAGLKLHKQVDDVDNDGHYGIPYERKRHQNGKSFHQVTLHGERKKQSSTLFIFRRRKDGEESAVGDVVAATKDTPSRKRKAESELKLEFACDQCDRSFKSAQGLRTHVHMVHELEAGKPAKVLLQCEFCERTFKKEDAKRQHQLAKHGNDPSIKPDWYEKQQTRAEAETANRAVAIDSTGKIASSSKDVTQDTESSSAHEGQGKTCSICRISFKTKEEFDGHWQNLQPRAAAKRKCLKCSREFDEERALRQHSNFCNSTTNELPR